MTSVALALGRGSESQAGLQCRLDQTNEYRVSKVVIRVSSRRIMIAVACAIDGSRLAVIYSNDSNIRYVIPQGMYFTLTRCGRCSDPLLIDRYLSHPCLAPASDYSSESDLVLSL